MSQPSSGVVLQPVDGPERFKEMVREVEMLGFDNLWLTDSSLHARNCYSYLALAAEHSARLKLGTAVTNPLTRHPAITAAAIATIDEISGGRAILGIGTGDRPLLALGMKPSPLSALEATIEAVRRLWSGQEVDMGPGPFSLHQARLRFPGRPGLPVYISGSGPRTLQLAGRVGDGAILLVGLFPEAVAWAVQQVRQGEEQVRQGEEGGAKSTDIAVFAYGAICEDRDLALEEARSIAAWFPQTAPVICRLAGLDDDVVARVQQAYGGGEFQEAAQAARLLPPEFVRRVALAGDAADARRRISEVLDAGASSVHVFPLGHDRIGTVRSFARCWREVTGAAP
jgi:5,10-methylenetetrahydromethanopterin reductase